MKKLKYLLLPVAFLLQIALGYVRDFTFVHINRYMSAVYYHKKGFLPASLEVFRDFNYGQLYQVKFALTISFAIAFLTLTVAIVYLFFRKRLFIIYTVSAFTIICIISGMFFLYGWFLDDYERGYRFSRVLMGFVQSPLLVMILLPAFQLYQKREA